MTPSTAPDVRLAQRWTALWNGELAAEAVVSPECSVYFGRRPMIARVTTAHGPTELQAVVDAIRANLMSVRYGFATAPLSHGGAGRDGVLTLLWHVSALGLPRRSGIDLLRHAGDKVIEAWSITGDLELPPLRQPAPISAAA